MSKQLKIGLLDSGIGGFTLLRELIILCPSSVEVRWNYVADDLYAPYGLLSAERVGQRTLFIGEKLVRAGVDLVVVACNTATAYGIGALRKKFPDIPFVGVEPYLNVLHREPELLQKGEGTAVLTTEMMSRSPRFSQLIERFDPNRNMTYYSCSQLASLIEQAYASSLPENSHSLCLPWVSRLDDECGFLRYNGHRQVILGCTHYPLIKDYFKHRLKIFPISPCQHVARQVYNRLQIDVGHQVPEKRDNKLQSANFLFRRTSLLDGTDGGLEKPTEKKAQELNLVLPKKVYEVLK